jgi:MerR family transcriptional regulator, thiopeptide resistance regulator
MKERRYQVKEAAKIAGVSVRTLRHYDEIGLLKPKQRSGAGYRLYGDAELLRLQQILIGRELGLPLEEIRRTLDDPSFDQRRALTAQRRLLVGRAESTAAMIRAVDAALSLLDNRNEDPMSAKQLFEGFDSSKYEAEVEDRWGNTGAYAESKKRTGSYGAGEWRAINDEQAAIYTAAAEAMRAGKEPADESVMDIAERHRLLIDRWFYACSTEMHCALSQLYESDGRFAASIDKFGAGLHVFLSSAIRENARRRYAKPPIR